MISLMLLALLATNDPQRADLADLHPVTGPEAPPPLPPATVWPWIVLATAFGLGLSGWLVKRRWNRPRAEPPPHVWAAREFEQLTSRDWSDPVIAERFAIIIRGYLRRRVPAVRESLTSGELALCFVHSDIPEDVITGWKSLLDRCDLAKFARQSFTTEESAEALRRAQTLLAASLPKSEAATPA